MTAAVLHNMGGAEDDDDFDLYCTLYSPAGITLGDVDGLHEKLHSQLVQYGGSKLQETCLDFTLAIEGLRTNESSDGDCRDCVCDFVWAVEADWRSNG